MPKILRNKLFRNWFGHPVQSLRSLCSLILQCRILKSWIRARINECMSYCTKMNEWPFFIIITRSTMQTFAKFKIVVLCISVSFYWDLINDWISMMRWYFFFLFRILYLNGVNFQHCIYNLLHVDSWKCNIFRVDGLKLLLWS